MSRLNPQYIIVRSDRYEADRDRHFLSLGRVLGPDYAGEWFTDILRVEKEFGDFPGPLSWAIDEEASAVYRQEVRRLLYYGPTRRRNGKPVRILFSVLPPNLWDPEDDAETVILLLRLLHGAQRLQPEDTEEA